MRLCQVKHIIPKIILSTGEPGGIGPDILIKGCYQSFAAALVVIGDPGMIAHRARRLGLDVRILECDGLPEAAIHQPGVLQVIPESLEDHSSPGQLNPGNSRYVVRCIDGAVDRCLSGQFDAMVTAPVHKGVINEAGISFSGHTEWIAKRTGVEQPVMLLAGANIKVCLATTHLSVRDVPDQITGDRLEKVLTVMLQEFRRLFGLERPKIGVCGLNPHAGEGGHLGTEEIDTIIPVIRKFQQAGHWVYGPFPADTIFTGKYLKQYHGILAMYHDQGLPVVKHAGFGEVVNVTLGLPIIRTSVDHGTALDLAGTGEANESSLVAAINLAIQLSGNQVSVS